MHDSLMELIAATAELVSSMSRFLIALRKFEKSGGGRPSLVLLRSTIEDGLKRMEDGLNLVDVGPDDGPDST